MNSVLSLFFAALVGAGIAGGAAALASDARAQALVQLIATTAPNIYADTRLLCFCVVGSVMGAFLAVACFPDNIQGSERNAARRVALKFGSSLASGVALTPGLLRRVGWADGEPDTIVCASAVVACFAVLAIHAAAPVIGKWFARR